MRFSCYLGTNRVLVEHLGEHIAHEPASLEDRRASRLPPLLKQWLQAKLADGHTPQSLRNLLRLSDEDLEAIEANPAVAPDTFFIADHDFDNLFRRVLNQDGRLHPDLWQSLTMWKEKLEKAGGSVFFDRWTTGSGDTNFQFCFMTKWQKQLISEGIGSSIVCLDSTHNTSFTMQWGEGQCPLSTLVAKHTASGQGVPLAFMIASSEEHAPLQKYLSWITKETNFQPKAIMIDCSNTEALAVEKAWPATAIRYCRWHLLRAVYKKIREKVKVRPGSRSKGDQAKAQAETHLKVREAHRSFMQLVLADSQDELVKRWEIFKQEWKEYKDWLQYVEGQWMGVVQRWAAFGRTQGDQVILTNNYIEAWHGVLKGKHLGNRRKQRVDLLVHILVHEALPDLRQRMAKVSKAVNARTRTVEEDKRYKAAHQLPIHTAQAMVDFSDHSPSSVLVDSFTGDSKYRVRLQGERISECNCQDWIKNSLPCKHMHLVQRVLPFQVVFEETSVDVQVGLGVQASAKAVARREQEEEDLQTQIDLVDVDTSIDFLRNWIAAYNEMDVIQRNSGKHREMAAVISQKLQDACHAARQSTKSYAARQ